MNQLQIIGNLGADADEPRNVNGKVVVNFRVAVNGKRKEDDVTWFRCAMWGERAEKVFPFLVKGKKVFVQGPVQIETFKRDNGQEGHSLKVMVNDLELLSGGDDRTNNNAGSGNKQSGGNETDPFGNG